LSVSGYRLLAQIDLALPNQAAGAKTAALDGLALDPANRQLRQLLIQAYQNLGDSDNALRQQRLLKQLDSGKI
jgi:DNA-binding SARP family transcriptional activator